MARLAVSGANKRLEDMGAPGSARPVNMYPYVARDKSYLIFNPLHRGGRAALRTHRLYRFRKDRGRRYGAEPHPGGAGEARGGGRVRGRLSGFRRKDLVSVPGVRMSNPSRRGGPCRSRRTVRVGPLVRFLEEQGIEADVIRKEKEKTGGPA